VADPVTSLASIADFTQGAFGDLVLDYPPDALQDALNEGTRLMEDFCDRRLAGFTGLTETTRASGLDTDEYAGSPNMPLSTQGTLGESYASTLGIQNLVRHCWLSQYPPHYQDQWSYGAGQTIIVIRSYGGTQNMYQGQILDGPDNTGHIWFQLGQFIPPGSRIRVTYDGGYTTSVPASLVRANKNWTAALILRELTPDQVQHNPAQLLAEARDILTTGKWVRW
jgi:hypothetical protein